MLTGFWLLFAWLWPLLLAGPALTRRLWWLPPLGALPALLIGFALPLGSQVELPWLMLGTRLGLDATGQVFLIFTSIVWLAAGVFAAAQRWRALSAPDQDRHAARFSAFFLLAMAGNFWLILGLDLISFYVGFAIMGLASYVLVIHDGDLTALRAGRVYLAMALVGEVLLFAALAMIVAETGTTAPEVGQLAALSNVAIALALLGLGVKAGIFPLHLWLPLAHPAAPIAASAVLSGTMIKVALLGWLRFLPVGVLALPHWGAVLILLGLFTLFYGLGVGLTQRDPKTILAYSSISKMGFLLVLLGLVLMQPALAPLGVVAIALYAAHHGLVKGGLFLGIGLRKHAEAMRQPLILGGLGFLALAMAGAPLTTGAVAKDATKPLLAGLPAAWGELWGTLGGALTVNPVGTEQASGWWSWLVPDPAMVLGLALVLSTMVTVALMARLLWVAKHISIGNGAKPLAGEAGAEIAWALLIQTIIILPFAMAQPKALLANGIPVALGVGLVAGTLWLVRRGQLRLAGAVGRVPPGDLLALVVPLYRIAWVLGALFWVRWQAMVTAVASWVSQGLRRVLVGAPGDPERELRGWPVAGALWLMVGGGLLIALVATKPLWVVAANKPAADGQPAAATQTAGPEPEPEPLPLAMRPMDEETTGVIPADPWVTPDAASASSALAEKDSRRSAPMQASNARDEQPGARAAEAQSSEPKRGEEEGQADGADLTLTDGEAQAEQAGQNGGQTRLNGAENETGKTDGESAADESNQIDGDGQTQGSLASASAQQGDESENDQAAAPEADARSPLCESDAPFVFSQADDPDTAIELTQCVANGDGGWRSLGEPKLSNRLVLILQRNLEWLEYNSGSTDGMIGPSTRDAIRAFQQAQGMRSTGGISFRLLRAIKAEIERRQAN
ncbi:MULTISPECIES: proton-conducting transporter transmembrane domain-containing protein [Thiorhodovibrio]|uniref:proton-conducting transporter transmembrane domain-containing protein n=1 Tax=Thiorhodovibrio TaxID=61593 RepID=UPI001913FBEB|nr:MULTISPECIES: proton-conducting transporter membrane subunit [Thiorhodovibrio]WPL10708.1 Hydrogenase-4 component B [Thiorhodovibrio litoralis]